MPLYEFLCESCGRSLELILSFSEPQPTLCDRCGGRLKKLLSAPAVQFKGSGWYVSDYGKGGSSGKSAEGKGGGKDGGKDKEPSPSAESKPESKDTPASPPKTSD